MTSDKPIPVCAALIVGDQRLLIAKRKPGLQQGGLWEFPGGKQHPGESPQQCLVREIREEFGITIRIGEHFASTLFAYPDYTIALSAYWATCSGCEGAASAQRLAFDNFILTDHSEVRWVSERELGCLYRDLPSRQGAGSVSSLSPADIPIADKLLSSNWL